MAKDGGGAGILTTPFRRLLLSLTPEQQQVLQLNIKNACHDRRHCAADPRLGRTKRHRRFGKKLGKKYK